MHEFDTGDDFDPWQKIQMMLGIGGRSKFAIPSVNTDQAIFLKELQERRAEEIYGPKKDFVKAIKVPGLPEFQEVPGLPGLVCQNPYIPQNGMCVHRIPPTAAPAVPSPPTLITVPPPPTPTAVPSPPTPITVPSPPTPITVPSPPTPQCPPGSKLSGGICYDERVDTNQLVKNATSRFDKCAIKSGNKMCFPGLKNNCPDGYSYKDGKCYANVISKF